MILFDIRKIPEGFDLGVWNDFYKNGILFFDSELIGLDPIRVEEDKLVLIDTENMTDEDWTRVNEVLEIRDQERTTKDEEARNILRANNQKLIDYLKKINNENV